MTGDAGFTIEAAGAIADEIAAILAVLESETDEPAPGREPAMPAWRRAARRESTGAIV